jgi:hypothetical protein
MTGDSLMLVVAAGLPPMAVPMTVKMPEPMTAPMPSAVSETGPRVFLRACSGSSLSRMSLSMDLVAKICRGSVRVLVSERWERSYSDCMRGVPGAAGGVPSPRVLLRKVRSIKDLAGGYFGYRVMLLRFL